MFDLLIDIILLRVPVLCFKRSFFSDVKDKYKRYTYLTCAEMIDGVYFLLDNIFIRFGNKI